MKSLVDSLRSQADACIRLGSPLYANLLWHLADHIEESETCQIEDVLEPYQHARNADAVPLRLLGTVHRLVLEGRAPRLAPFFPTAGGGADHGTAEQAWLAFQETILANLEVIDDGLESIPQTNEVARAAGLVGGILHALDTLGFASNGTPGVRLFEIGTSGGLLLRGDQYRYESMDGYGWGPEASPVLVHDAWRGAMPPGGDGSQAFEVTARTGADLRPVDVTSEEGRLHLLSFVWPEHVGRFHRLDGAIDIARDFPATFVTQKAADFVAEIDTETDRLTVLWHSLMWQYVEEPERAEILREVSRIGREATADAPFAYITLEPTADAEGLAASQRVVVRTWPGADVANLASGTSHGTPILWERTT